jgi:hypothetical protein
MAGEATSTGAVFCDHLVTVDLHVDAPIPSGLLARETKRFAPRTCTRAPPHRDRPRRSGDAADLA